MDASIWPNNDVKVHNSGEFSEMEQDVPHLHVAGRMLLKARIISSFHSLLNPACREMGAAPSVSAGKNYCRGLSGHCSIEEH